MLTPPWQTHDWFNERLLSHPQTCYYYESCVLRRFHVCTGPRINTIADLLLSERQEVAKYKWVRIKNIYKTLQCYLYRELTHSCEHVSLNPSSFSTLTLHKTLLWRAFCPSEHFNIDQSCPCLTKKYLFDGEIFLCWYTTVSSYELFLT